MSTTDLLALIKSGEIRKGRQIIKVPIEKADGGKYDGQTYLIPLKYLYYNDQNGRIGTAISEYEAQHGEVSPSNTENYNLEIQQILEGDDNKSKKAMSVLVRDMDRKGQERPGYVLNDGRVIDGNRRFTAHRILEQDPAVTTPQYFEAVIIDDLDADRYNDKKQLKSLELKLQFGSLGRQDYDPIDRAIDVYKSIKVYKTMTNEGYAQDAEMSKTDVDKKLYEAELIIEFLKFINADQQNYAIAKQLSLDGPLQNLVPQYKKYIRDAPDKDEILGVLFTKLLQLRQKANNDADFKKDFRPIVTNVINTDREKDLIESMAQPVDTIVDKLAKKRTTSAEDLMTTISATPEVVHAIETTQEVTSNIVEESIDSSNRAKPTKLIKQAQKKLESIDTSVLQDIDEDEQKNVIQELDLLSEQIESLKAKME